MNGEKPTRETGKDNRKRVLLDTTLQIDRLKYPSRRSRIEEELSSFSFKFASSISLLEFKATFIAQCIHIHTQLSRRGARYTQVRDRVLEKNHPQVKLRMHIFNNHIAVFPPASAFEIDDETDLELAETARLALENIIPDLYSWFISTECSDSLLRDRICCNRAGEPPVKKRVAFDTNLPNCRRGRNKTCHVEEVIRSDGRELALRLEPLLDRSSKDHAQLAGAIDLFNEVINTPDIDLSSDQCRKAGDALIALEGKGKATHAASTNARDWRPISTAADYEFVHVVYPDERSR